ncbi:MAG TPA: ATP-binding protein, partial [Gammaproteobacteria bacterium]
DAGGTARLGDLLLAYAPVSWQGQRVGSVVVEQRIDQLLLSRYGAFAELALATLGLFGLSVAGLLLFASRLAWRIRRLGRETGAALDERGRLLAERLAAESGSGDELGDLSRAISGLLGRLQRHTRFLHALPRTLRHEISNPLNTIATALQNLGAESSPAQRERYLAGANRGLQRLEATLNGLTEAANLDEALQQEEHRPLDLRELLATYLDSLQLQYPERRLLAALPAGAVTVHGAGHRLEQLLDKLFDNALDFTPADGRIGLGLELSGGQAQLRVENSGPPLPPALQGQAGEAMVSSRQPGSGAQHLGLGLFVARRIAEAHGGTLALGNLADGSGVGVSVALPLARPAGRAAG